jgi:hypothetical protein
MSRARDKYANIKKERFLGSYIILGKDKRLRVVYSVDMNKSAWEIKNALEIQGVVQLGGASEEQTQVIKDHFKPFQHEDSTYLIQLDLAKSIVLALFPDVEWIPDPWRDEPKHWKTLSSWTQGEVKQGYVSACATPKRFAQRYLIRSATGEIEGLFTNEHLHNQLKHFKDGSLVRIECKKPFIAGEEDTPNQPSRFEVISAEEKRSHVKTRRRYQLNS